MAKMVTVGIRYRNNPVVTDIFDGMESGEIFFNKMVKFSPISFLDGKIKQWKLPCSTTSFMIFEMPTNTTVSYYFDEMIAPIVIGKDLDQISSKPEICTTVLIYDWEFIFDLGLAPTWDSTPTPQPKEIKCVHYNKSKEIFVSTDNDHYLFYKVEDWPGKIFCAGKLVDKKPVDLTEEDVNFVSRINICVGSFDKVDGLGTDQHVVGKNWFP